MGALRSILHLGIKELWSLARDILLVGLIVYAFTYAVYGPATGARMDLRNASVGFVDDDRSILSRRLVDALLPPYFLPPQPLAHGEAQAALDAGRYTFVVEIPPRFQADVEAGRRPAILVQIDATAMTHAGRGSAYIQAIFEQELARFAGTRAAPAPVNLVTRARFNPNLDEGTFLAIAHIIEDVTMLGIILCGAAVVREREHGTLEHLLAMPLTATQIMAAKVWPNSLVIVAAATLSLQIVVRELLGVPVQGSLALFVAGAALYMASIASLSILLATFARSMPQFGLLVFVVFIVLNMLSGGATPPDSMPHWLQQTMKLGPTAHFVNFSVAVLCRGATLADVAPEVAMIAATGAVFFAVALARFRRTVAAVPA